MYQLFCGTNNQESGVEAIRIIRDSNVGLGKGIAYVLFKTKVWAFCFQYLMNHLLSTFLESKYFINSEVIYLGLCCSLLE